jgi:hypothetical protein
MSLPRPRPLGRCDHNRTQAGRIPGVRLSARAILEGLHRAATISPRALQTAGEVSLRQKYNPVAAWIFLQFEEEIPNQEDDADNY